VLQPNCANHNVNVSVSGLPHASTEDDIYRGFFIPKGTFILLSILVIE
jgi:hypothetical protein